MAEDTLGRNAFPLILLYLPRLIISEAAGCKASDQIESWPLSEALCALSGRLHMLQSRRSLRACLSYH